MVFFLRLIILYTYQKRWCYCLLILFSYAVKPSLDIAIWKCRYTNLTNVLCGTTFYTVVARRHCLFSNFADKLRRQILFKFNKNWKYIFIEAKKSKQSKENYSLIIKMSFFSTKNFFFLVVLSQWQPVDLYGDETWWRSEQQNCKWSWGR